jgi:hypothetical protein
MTEINPNNPNERGITFGPSVYTEIKSSTIVKLNENLILDTEDGPVTLLVEISSDFNGVDEKYREIFFNMFTSKYHNRVSFGDNPFSICKPIQKRKWYQFWKSKYFI